MTSKKTIMILATGGTIAGSGENGKTTGYNSGVIEAKELICAIPQLSELANIKVNQICNVNSDDITSNIWISLAKVINEMSTKVDGFVITHGTDTLEETAYFLNLVVKTDKPIVLTGSMRPSTSLSADGPMNLYEAVCVATDESSIGRGVLVVFADKIYTARDVIKCNTYNLMAISAGEMGSIGVVRDERVEFYGSSSKLHTINSEFDIRNVNVLPKVSVVYFNVDSDVRILKYAAEISEGLVIAGAGAGEFSKEYIEAISNIDIPVVISSRVNDGIISQSSLLCENTIAANNLPPQKAAVLLRLALTRYSDKENLVKLFSSY